MAVEANVLRDLIRTALQTSPVADAAEISSAVWAADGDAGGHVFDGNGGFIGARNRGRLPFLEFRIVAQQFTQQTYTGGQETSQVAVRVHVGGRDIRIAQDRAYAIAKAAVTAIRSVFGTTLGNEAIPEFGQGPWGHALEVKLTVEQSYAKAAP